MSEFQDKGVVITGASRGIGKRLALGFAAAGARIGLIARGKAELDLTQLEIDHQGGKAMRLRADVTDAEALRLAIDRFHAQSGAVDVLICAAGIQGPVGPFLATLGPSWHETLTTNLAGVANACAAALPEMVDRRKGKIVILSGGGGATPRPNFTAYAASKAAVIRFAECLAEETRENNVQVNCMAPGNAYTAMTDEILAAGEQAGWRELEDARQVRITGGFPAEKQVALAMFLASERSNHVSGKLVHVKDDWKRLETITVTPDLYTLRRVQKV